MSNEIHPAVEASNVNSRNSSGARPGSIAYAAEVLLKKHRRKATLTLTVRIICSLLLIAGIAIASAYGLMAWQLAVPVQCVILVYAAVWFGAWLQFCIGKEGLLK